MLRVLVVVAVSVVFVSCGPPKAGDSCSPPGGATCGDTSTWLLCNANNQFRAYNCPGALGCATKGQSAVCDFAGAADGDECPTGIGAIAFCADSKTARACNQTTGRFDSRTCSSCTTDAATLQATCAP